MPPLPGRKTYTSKGPLPAAFPAARAQIEPINATGVHPMKALLIPLAACAVLSGCVGYGNNGVAVSPYGTNYPYGTVGTYPYGTTVYPGTAYPSTAYPGVAYPGTAYPATAYPGYVYGAQPVYPTQQRNRDRDGDGIPNRVDPDRDGDGVPNQHDRYPRDPRRQ
jgi:hypothetical protein